MSASSVMKPAAWLLTAGLTLLAGSERLYVVNTGGSSLSVVDPISARAIGEIRVSKHPHAIALSADGKRFYVTSEEENVLDVVDRASERIVKRIPLGKRPNNLALTPDGRRLYVCIRGESWVDVVDTEKLEKVKSISVGGGPHNVYAWPDGRWMIATSMDESKLTVIDTQTEAPAFSIPLGGVPRPLAVDAPRNRLYVQLSELHGFVVVDMSARKVTQKVELPPAPEGAKPLIPHTFSHGINVGPDGQTLWVASMLADSVYVYALPDLKLLATTPVGKAPDWMTFSPDGARCYVSNAGSDSVSVIDVASRTERSRIPVGSVPKRLIAIDVP
jgi:YVTN family beta-propeller protein